MNFTLLLILFSLVIISSTHFVYAESTIIKSPDQSIMNEPTYISCNIPDAEGQVFVMLKDLTTNFPRQLLSPVEVVIYNDHTYHISCMWYVDDTEQYSDDTITFEVTPVSEPTPEESNPAVLYGELPDDTLTITPANPTIHDNILIECDFPQEYGTSIQFGHEVDYHLEEFEIRIFKDGNLIWAVHNAYPDADTGKYGSTRPALIDPSTIDGGGIGEYRAYCGFYVIADGYWIDENNFYEYKSGNRNFEDEKYFTVVESTTEPSDDLSITATQLFIDYRITEINDKLYDTQSKLDSYLMRKANTNSFTTSTDSKVQFYLDKITKLESIKENLLRIN